MYINEKKQKINEIASLLSEVSSVVSSKIGNGIKTLKEGDIDTALSLFDEVKKIFNETFTDSRGLVEGFVFKNENLYGENLNFGVIYKTLEENATKLYKDSRKSNAFYKTLKEISANKILKEQFDCYQMFVNPTDISDAKAFVDEAVKLIPNLEISEVKNKNHSLIKSLETCGIDETVEITDDFIDLCESVEYLMFNKPTAKNVKEISEAKNTIVDYIEKYNKETSRHQNNDNMDAVANGIYEGLSEKYEEELTDEEKLVIEKLSNDNGSVEVFNEYKQKAETLLNSFINEEQNEEKKSTIKQMLDEVSEKKYNKSELLNDLYLFIKVKEIVGDN